jgi:antitoxin PrlF
MTMVAFSRLTKKFQTTIPLKVRGLLGLQAGDSIGFEVKNGEVVLKKASHVDVAHAKALEGTLSEWASAEDEEAYGDL